MLVFFRCVAKAVVANGVKGLATMVPGGAFVCDVAKDAWKEYREITKDEERRAEIQQGSRLTFEEARREAVAAAREAIGGGEPSIELELYLAQIPAAVQQSLKRPEDPSGLTVPMAFSLSSPADVLRLLPPRPPRFRPGDQLPGRPGWLLARVLGVGGFGEVWLANHPHLASVTGAVKFCHGRQADDLRREGGLIDRVTAAGEHPNIVRLRDAQLDIDTPWLMYDYVAGGDLADWIRQLQRVPGDQRVKQSVAALRQLAGAVGHFHRLSPALVHRDLKPSNILLDLTPPRKLKVTDFGIGAVAARAALVAEATGSDTHGGRLQSSMRGAHTPLYASPQQRSGEDPDPRDDVHALGVIGYQLITGDLDRGAGPDFADDLREHNAPEALITLLGRCVAQRADRRPADANALAAELSRLGADSPSLPLLPTPPATPQPTVVVPPTTTPQLPTSPALPPPKEAASRPTPAIPTTPSVRTTSSQTVDSADGSRPRKLSYGGMPVEEVECISTGCLGLDIVLGGKGIPRGRVVEIYGAEASGKTTVALHAVANVQKAGGVAAFIDADHAFDPSWAKRIGVDLDTLLVSQPGNGEEGLRIAEILIKSNTVGLIVIDSVGALVPRNVIQDSGLGDTEVAPQLRLMSQALRILTPKLKKSRACLLVINQLQQNLGVMGGDPSITASGPALKFYASVRMEMKRTSDIKDSDGSIGTATLVRVVKNKVAPSLCDAEIEILYDRGIDFAGDLLKLALEEKLIEKSGASFCYKGQPLGQGKAKAVKYLRENSAVRADLTAAVLEKRIPKPASQEQKDASAAAAKDEADAAAELAAIGEAPEPATEPKERCGSRATRE